MKDYQTIIDKYYPVGTHRRDIYIRHCKQIACMAIDICHKLKLDIDEKQVETAAMLHDIGIFLTDAESIDCHGTEHYLRHGILGAELLRKEDYPEKIARVSERHTGAGITADEIIKFGLPLPPKDLLPETQLERLICYADKFFSKSGDMKQKTIEQVIASIEKFGEQSASRFAALHKEFS